MARKKKWSFIHTWRQRTDTFTKKDAAALLRAWKQEKESAGWTVVGSLSRYSLMAFAPGADHAAELARVRAGKPPKLAASAAVHPVDFPSFPETAPLREDSDQLTLDG